MEISSVGRAWERLLQTSSEPCLSATLSILKSGSLLFEVGQPPEWKPFEVFLARCSTIDLKLYYYPHKPSSIRLGSIRLQRAQIDRLDDVLMVVTKDKTWFLCASTVQEATDWTDAICYAIERLHERQIHQTTEVSTLSLGQWQAQKDSKTRATEFLEMFVYSTKDDLYLSAVNGTLSLSCMRTLVWKLWLNYLPETVPLTQWLCLAREKRRKYENLRRQQRLFQNLLCGKQPATDFLEMCENATNNELYTIYIDVCRTRMDLPFFRHPVVQCIMIRVLYVYTVASSNISYHQGMGELLATLLYVLYLEQWPPVIEIGKNTAQTNDGGRLSNLSVKRHDVHVDTCSDTDSFFCVTNVTKSQQDDPSCSSCQLLRFLPFAVQSKEDIHACCRTTADAMVRELMASAFIEHDAYLLLEEMMGRMAGTYCSHGAQSHGTSPPQVETSLSFATSLLVSPLDHHMNRIHLYILSQCDPHTAAHLANLRVEPQLYLLRWVRVLLAREFHMAQVWQLWDAIFSLTPRDFSFIHVLCVALALTVRDEIVAAHDAMSVLLRLREASDRINVSQLVNNARELYNALVIAAAIQAAKNV